MVSFKNTFLDKCMDQHKIKHTDFNDNRNHNGATIYTLKEDISRTRNSSEFKLQL